MKKILFFLVFLSAFNLRFAFAEESFEASKVSSEDQSAPAQDVKPKTSVPVLDDFVKSEKSAPVEPSSGSLVNLDMSRATARIGDLERRIDDLERDKRFQDDRIRSLERSIDDLKRSGR